jgi:hypothetical protein
MHMADWIRKLDDFIRIRRLISRGSIEALRPLQQGRDSLGDFRG